MEKCPNCGTDAEEGQKFCRNCGQPSNLSGEDAPTWHLPQDLAGPAEQSNPTAPVRSNPTTHQSPLPGADSYSPPVPYYPPAPPGYYQQPPLPAPYVPVPQASHVNISLGDWLSGGWQVYKENWLLMSLATFLGSLMSLATIGILAGPFLMALYRMAFKTMRGERPNLGDLFAWEGKFLQAFLTFLIFVLVHGGLSGAGNSGGAAAIIAFIITPLLAVTLGLTMPLISEHRMDVAKAINTVGRLIFSKDAIMWWVVGLVFSTISVGGVVACGVGIFITLPWIICSGAVAARDIFGFDDPNRTLH